MSIKLTWGSQVGQGLEAIEVYRSDKYTVGQTPSNPIAILSGDAVEYVDADVIENSAYYYILAAVKAGNRTYSKPRHIPYLSKWGPVADKEIARRGALDSFYLGQVSNNQLPDIVALRGILPSLSAQLTIAHSGWVKFYHRGKVLFFPDAAICNASWDKLNAAGVVFGENDPAKLPSWAATGVEHKTVVTIGENEYIVRLPSISNEPLSTFLTDQAQTVDSEYRSTLARMSWMGQHASAAPTAQPRLGDWGSYLPCHGQHLKDASNVATMSSAANEHERLISRLKNSAAATFLAFELIL